jgi:hypothetical protein
MKKINYDFIPREIFKSWAKSVKFLQSWESIDRAKGHWPEKTTAELFGEKLLHHIEERILHEGNEPKLEPLQESELQSDLKVFWEKVNGIYKMAEDTFNAMHNFDQNKINQRIDWINEYLKKTYVKDTS